MINIAMIVGNVGNKEIKKLKNGGELTVLSIATNKKFKDDDGEKKEKTTWHNVSCFNRKNLKLADIAAKYVEVGDLILVQGEIENRKMETGEKAGQYMYSIFAYEIKFLLKRNSINTQKSSEVSAYFNNFDDSEIPF